MSIKAEELIKKYLKIGEMMQVATVDGDQPWICTLYYVFDDSLNLYWISLPDRRHSKEIAKHAKVAAAIPIKHHGHPVVGLQIEGEALLVTDQNEIVHSMKLYADKFKTGEDWYNEFVAGKNEHKLYKITPRLFVLCDEENFPDNTRQEWRLS